MMAARHISSAGEPEKYRSPERSRPSRPGAARAQATSQSPGPNLATEAETRHLTTCQKRVPTAATEEETPNPDPTARNPQARARSWRSWSFSSRKSHASSDRCCASVRRRLLRLRRGLGGLG